MREIYPARLVDSCLNCFLAVVRQMYNLANALSKSFSGPNKSEWMTVAQTAVVDVSRDQYGENRMWSSTLNGNPNQAAAAWQMSTLALNNVCGCGKDLRKSHD